MVQNEFVTLITPFKDKVFRLAQRLLTSREEAEDATQEVLVKLWNKEKAGVEIKNREAFAMTITKNYCLDQLKSKRAENLPITHANYEDRNFNLGNKIDDFDSLNWVEKIINQLPEQQRLIIQLRDVEQYEFKEIANIVGMNETAIRVALSRARKTVRENMIKTNDYGIRNY